MAKKKKKIKKRSAAKKKATDKEDQKPDQATQKPQPRDDPVTIKKAEDINLSDPGRAALADQTPGGQVPGIPSTEGRPAVAADIFSKELVGELVALPYAKIAESKGQYWKLSKSEKDTLGELGAQCLNKYVAKYLGDYPEIVGFILAAGMITAPRIIKMQKQKKEEQKKEIKKK